MLKIRWDELPLLRGWYVYQLRDSEGCVIYVGRSENTHLRMGDHLTRFGDEIASAVITTCRDEWAAHALEADLIEREQPKHNKHGRSGFAPVRAPAVCRHPLSRKGECRYHCRAWRYSLPKTAA